MDSPSQDGVFGQQRTQDSNNTATDMLESPLKAINRFGLRPSPQNSEDSSSDDDQVPTQDLQSPSRAANLFTIKPSRPQGTIGDPTRTEVLRPPASASATPPVSNPSHLDDVQTIGDDLNAHRPSSDHSPNFPVPMDVLPPPSTVLGPKQFLPPSKFKDGSLQGPDVSHAEFIRLGSWEGTVDLLDSLQKHEDTLRRLYANKQSTLKDLYRKRQTALAGFICQNLDSAQTDSILRDIKDDSDPKAQYNALLKYYQPQTAQSRTAAFQALLTARKTDDESYSDFGSRIIALSQQIKDRLPTLHKYTKETTYANNITAGTASGSPATGQMSIMLTPSEFKEFYSIYDVIHDIMSAVAIMGLPHDEDSKYLCNTLTHLDTVKGLDQILDPLCTANKKSPNRRKKSSKALALSSSTPSEKKKYRFTYKEHGDNNSHNDDHCITQLREKSKKRSKANVAQEDSDSDNKLDANQQALMAGVANITNKPQLCTRNMTADNSWNTDLGATSHMTPHLNWMRNMKKCKIPITLTNDHVVYVWG
ncbi:hypothetical protein BKA70DRAFT_1438154 [Coprinopsis sp. MPI-PUGE-AT-0042]|nr:hypothetical protein BKA70DRAFT_1438154 [Coprinopsis sp. MPI-PUGE-AT-0042]